MPTTSKALPEPTSKQLLIEHRYGGDLAADINAMAEAGTSWREIARRVSANCEHDVSYQSLRNWYHPGAHLVSAGNGRPHCIRMGCDCGRPKAGAA